MPPDPASNSTFRSRFWRWGRVAVPALVIVLLLVWAARSSGVVGLMEKAVVELRHLGAPVFFSAMAILPALGFPLLPFAFAAGPAFAPVLGTGGVVACAILAVCVNVALSYQLAATVFRPPVQWLVTRLGYRLPDPSRHNPWFVTLLARLAPGLPFWAQSYLLGLVRVPFFPYLTVSTLVPAGYLTAAILFGDALRQRDPRQALVALGVLALVGTGMFFLRRRLQARARGSVAGDRLP